MFRFLGFRRSISFRMFPDPNLIPEYSTQLTYSYAVILILSIPRFVQSDRHQSGHNTAGFLLCPLAERLHPTMEFVVMFARVRLAMACINATSVQLTTDPGLRGLRVYCPSLTLTHLSYD